MEANTHSMTQLFSQLGLPAEPSAIQAFIALHRPLAARTALHEASFWTPVQAAFLREKIEDDPAQPRFIVTVRGHGYRFSEDNER